MERQKKFAVKYKLKLRLLADDDKKVARAFGAWGTKKMYGKEVKGLIRSTFLIDPMGKIARVWSSVKVDGHPEKVLEAIPS